MTVVDETLLDRARDHAVRFLAGLPDRRAGVSATYDELLPAMRVPISAEGEAASAVLDALAGGADPGIMASAGPSYFGFVIGGSLPVAVAVDWLTTAWDQNAGIYVTSPAASVVEDVAREWLLELFDLPRTASVGFVTGGQMGNFPPPAPARPGGLRRARGDVGGGGPSGA